MKEHSRLTTILCICISVMIFVSCNNEESNVDHFQKGIDLYHQGLFDEAIEELDKAVLADPNASAPYEAKSEIYRMTGKLDLSLQSLNEAINTRPEPPDNIRLYRVRGRTHDMLGNIDLAEKDLGSAISLSPEDATLYADRAWFYFVQEMYYKSVEDWERSMKLDPRDISTKFYSSLSYYKIGEYPRVIILNEEVIKVDPGHGNAHNQIGEAYIEMGEYQNALSALNTAIGLHDDRGIYYANRSRVYEKLGNTGLSNTDLKKACELNTDLRICQ